MTSFAPLARADILKKLLLALSLGAVAGSFVVQHGLGVDPCSLCVLQRLGYVGVAMFAGSLVACSRPSPCHVLTRVILALALAILGVAAYQTWLQAFPPPFSSCSAWLAMLLDDTPLERPWHFLMDAPGDCTEVTLRIAGLTLPQASLLLSSLIATVAARLLFVGRSAERASR
jgi:disulfide bond formation protein DsbB